VDPYHLDADPDSTNHPDANPDSDFYFIGSGFLFDPDPTFHLDADPDQDPSFQIKIPYNLARHIRIQLITLVQILIFI
jgi:hypothetical protein